MRGRKPTPTKLKILNGNPGKRPILGGEPEPARGVPEVPAFLSEAAKAEWAYYAPQLDACGLLTLADRATFAALCASIAEYVRARKLLDACPELVVDEETGAPVVNRMRSALRTSLYEAERSLRAWSSEYGLTPAVRARMGAVKNGAEHKDEFGEFLGRKKA